MYVAGEYPRRQHGGAAGLRVIVLGHHDDTIDWWTSMPWRHICRRTCRWRTQTNKHVLNDHRAVRTMCLELFGKSFDLSFSRTLGPYNVFILLNGRICLHGVLD